MTEAEVRELLRQAVKQAGSQTKFAKAHHLDRATVSLVLSPNNEHKVTPAILIALGLKRVVSYEPR